MGTITQKIVSICPLDLKLPDLPTESAMRHPDELDGLKHSPGTLNMCTQTHGMVQIVRGRLEMGQKCQTYQLKAQYHAWASQKGPGTTWMYRAYANARKVMQ